MTDRQKAVLLTIAPAAFESVRADEKPGSARYSKLTRGIDRLVELTDIYGSSDAWPTAEVNKAADLLDYFNSKIAEVFH